MLCMGATTGVSASRDPGKVGDRWPRSVRTATASRQLAHNVRYPATHRSLPRVGAPPLRARGPARSRHDPPTDRLAQPGLEPGEALALQAPELQTSRSLSSPPLVSAEGRNDTVSGRLALEAPQQSIDSGVGERLELVGLRTAERNAPVQGHARWPERIDRAGLLGQDARGILHRLELAPGDPGPTTSTPMWRRMQSRS